MQPNEDSLLAQALARCATEPIHLVGSIQPHGILIGIDDDQIVRLASHNCVEFFNRALVDCLGKPVSALLGEAQAQHLRNLKLDNCRYFELLETQYGGESESRKIDVHAYRSGGLSILEIEHSEPYSTETMESLFVLTRETLRSLHDHSKIADLAHYMAQQMRILTQFDRVLVYRFDHLWNGEVIAESRNTRMPSYLGNHFPASDIPPQARALYTINQIRALVDTEVQAITLEPAVNPLDGLPLDMSISVLRAMSPVHLAYLRNMGARSTITISLILKGELWGMICCHHSEPKKLSFRSLELAEVIGRMMASQLGVLQAAEYSAVMHQVRETLVKLTHMIHEGEDIGDLITLMEMQVLTLVHSTGAVIVIGKHRYDFGLTPSPDEVAALTDWIKQQPLEEATFATDTLSKLYPHASAYADVGAGLLAVALDASFEDHILWFRGEIVSEIVWAGNPKKEIVVDADGPRLDPHHSFEAWTHITRERAQPWLNVEIDAGQTLSRSFMAVLAQKARRAIEMDYLTLVERNTVILESAGDGVIGLDKDGCISFANHAATQFLATTKEKLIGRQVHGALHVYGGDAPERIPHLLTDCPIMRCFSEQRVVQNDHDAFSNERGHLFLVEYIVTPIFKSDKIDGAVLVFRDVTAAREAISKIEHQASHDALTDLPNRMLICDRLEHSLIAAERDGTYVGVMFLDLDRFKKINDSLGHSAGDFLLKQVAGRLQAIMRAADTVGRQGGDEFIVVIPGSKNQIHFINLAKKILQAVSAPYFYNEQELNITFSIGISVYPRDGTDSGKLIKNADVAMYYAKKSGRNNYQFYSPHMNDKSAQRLTLEVDMRYAVARHEFVVYYQPKVDAVSRKLIGGEALIRWNHPKVGLLGPDDFIAIAEECGQIIQIGHWVIQEVLRQNKIWFTHGLAYIPISVNLSAIQFHNEFLVDSLRILLEKIDMPPEFLELELTESILIQDTENALDTIRKLKALGLKLSIDDFGTGYSCLSRLKDFPFDTIKIDQSFVKDIEHDGASAALIKAIISMAHGLKMTTIAEGVESQEQSDFLEEQHCNEMQGYYFSHPVSAIHFEEMLKSPRGIHPGH